MKTTEIALDTKQMPNIEVVGQTPYEQAVEKIDKSHQRQATAEIEELKRKFAIIFYFASETIFRHGYTKKEFCNQFSAEERIALEKSMRQHPMYITRVTMYFMNYASVLLWIPFIQSLATSFTLTFWLLFVSTIISCPLFLFSLIGYFAGGLSAFPCSRHFFYRKKLIRLGGEKAVEDAIRKMKEYNEDTYNGM